MNLPSILRARVMLNLHVLFYCPLNPYVNHFNKICSHSLALKKITSGMCFYSDTELHNIECPV